MPMIMIENPLIALNLDERSIISLMSFSVLSASLFSMVFKVLCAAKLQLLFYMASIFWKKINFAA